MTDHKDPASRGGPNPMAFVLLVLVGIVGWMSIPPSQRGVNEPIAPLEVTEATGDRWRLPLSDPVPQVTSCYGYRIEEGRISAHEGVDLAAALGQTIVAVAPGIVSTATEAGDYGLLVELGHRDGTRTRYAHADQLLVEAGDRVVAGQALALVGMTGKANGPHLHFEVRRGRRVLDPLAALGEAAPYPTPCLAAPTPAAHRTYRARVARPLELSRSVALWVRLTRVGGVSQVQPIPEGSVAVDITKGQETFPTCGQRLDRARASPRLRVIVQANRSNRRELQEALRALGRSAWASAEAEVVVEVLGCSGGSPRRFSATQGLRSEIDRALGAVRSARSHRASCHALFDHLGRVLDLESGAARPQAVVIVGSGRDASPRARIEEVKASSALRGDVEVWLLVAGDVPSEATLELATSPQHVRHGLSSSDEVAAFDEVFATEHEAVDLAIQIPLELPIELFGGSLRRELFDGQPLALTVQGAGAVGAFRIPPTAAYARSDAELGPCARQPSNIPARLLVPAVLGVLILVGVRSRRRSRGDDGSV